MIVRVIGIALALFLSGCWLSDDSRNAQPPESPSESPPTPPPSDPPPISPQPPPEPPTVSSAVWYVWPIHWDSTITGYRIYFGRTLAAMTPVRDVQMSSCTANCETVFDTVMDIVAAYGDQLCFQSAALSQAGEMPARTPGICMTYSSVTLHYVDGRWPCGTGLAGTDLAGNCRRNPPTMGALEADG